MRRLVSFFILCLIAKTGFTESAPENTSQPIKPPVPYKAKYQAEWKQGWLPITVEATRKLSQSETGRWVLAFEVNSSLADLYESSSLELKADTLIPQTYVYKTNGFLTKEKREQVFHWQDKKVWGGHEDKFWDYELPLGAQDSLSYQEQLRLDLINGKKELSYPVIYKHKLKTYEFEIVGDAQLKTPHGTINTIEVKQLINDHNKLNTRIWFAKDYDFILVKLSQLRDGKGQIITLDEAMVGGKVLKAYSK